MSREPQEYEEVGQGNLNVRYPYEEIIFDRETEQQRVTLVRTRAFGRALFLDRVLNSTESDEFIYHEGIVHPAMVRARRRESVLIIGGAEGGALREVLRYPEVERAVMVDIDRELVDLCREHLGDVYGDPWSDPRVELYFADGAEYLAANPGFDVVVLDINEARDGGPAQLLFTREFYATVRNALSPGGVLSVQGEWITSAFHRRLVATLRSVFRGVRVQEVNIPSFLIGESFLLATMNPERLDISPERIDALLGDGRMALRYYNGEMDRRIGTLAPYQLAAYELPEEIFSETQLPVYDFSN